MSFDAIVVGAGPNGLTAAITLARAGLSVKVIEARDTIGGGCRSAELTAPGFIHDICSAIHPLGVGSPVLRTIPLEEHGVSWVHPDLPLAHPLDDGSAVSLHRSVDETAEGLGRDAGRYRFNIGLLARSADKLLDEFLGPLRPPRHPVAMANFGIRALLPAPTLARLMFKEERARAIFAGQAAHSMLPLTKPATSGVGLMLSILAHRVGWPLPRGGSQSIVDGLAGYLRSLGGEIETGHEVTSVDALPASKVVLFDVTPRQIVKIVGHRLPDAYRRRLSKYRYGMGVFKIDYALSEPVPWAAQACRGAGTVHVGGRMEEIVASEDAPMRGRVAERPFVICAQQSVFDDSRAPAGKHTLWAYCHVPSGHAGDVSGAIEAQIERFAPGFRDTILQRHAMGPRELEDYNANYIGGDINGGVQDLGQMFTRPVAKVDPYAMPTNGYFICSSSTPPGGGVHGMCGYHAARSALRQMRVPKQAIPKLG